jgi:hypothetical protein
MTGEILQGIIDECKALFEDTGGTVLFHTQFKPDKLPNYTMPLFIIHVNEAPDSGQMIGGVTRLDWQLAFKTYNYEPNAEVEEDSGYSTSLMDISDTVRQHFSQSNVLTESFLALSSDYNFLMEFAGITEADPIVNNEMITKGYNVNFNCAGIDTDTGLIEMSLEELEEVYQVPDEPSLTVNSISSPYSAITTLSIDDDANSTAQFTINSNTGWEIVSDKTWLTTNTLTGEGIVTITVTASVNAVKTSRSGILTISVPLSDLSDKTITVTQDASE